MSYRKTSHGTTSQDVLTLDPIEAFWDTEVEMLKWGTFVDATGRKGWNSVSDRLKAGGRRLPATDRTDLAPRAPPPPTKHRIWH